MGFFDLPGPLFDRVDTLISKLGSDWLSIMVWAAIASALSMAVYKFTSNQERLGKLKAAIAGAKLELNQNPPEDYAEAMQASRRLLAMSLRHVGHSILPTLVAGLPVIFIFVFLANTSSYVLPSPGAFLPATFHYRDGHTEQKDLAWPPSTDIVQGADANHIAPVVEKRGWLNSLFGNPAGYVAAASPIDSIEIAATPREFFPSLPSWAAGWEALFIAMMMVFSLTIKFAFRIQ